MEAHPQVLVGKVLVKAGADRKTLQLLDEVFNQLEMDRKPLTLAASLPPIFYLPENDTANASSEASQPERPVILFSVLKKVANHREARQLVQNWQDQAGGKTIVRPLLLGSVKETASSPVRLLQQLREGRTTFTRLEKFSVGLLALQIVVGTLWLAAGSRWMRPPVVQAVLANPIPAPQLAHRPVPPPNLLATLPVVRLGDFVYFSGGKIQIHWKSVGPAYRYRVYISPDKKSEHYYPATPQAISTRDFIWTKKPGVNWLAVKVVDFSGRKGPFSEPVYIGLH